MGEEGIKERKNCLTQRFKYDFSHDNKNKKDSWNSILIQMKHLAKCLIEVRKNSENCYVIWKNSSCKGHIFIIIKLN